jgi:cytochrome c5
MACSFRFKVTDMSRLLVPTLMLAGLLAACGKSADAPAAATAPAATPAAAATQTAAAAAENTQGEHVFKVTCSLCHATGAAGAPMFKSKPDWAPRIAQGKETLYAHALGGFNGNKGSMPARGGNPSLSDADVKSAVDFMVSAAQ